MITSPSNCSNSLSAHRRDSKRLGPLRFCLKRGGRAALVLLVFCGVGLACVQIGTALPVYDWQWHRVWRYLGRWTETGFQAGPLLEGLGLSVVIAAAAFVLAVGLGLVMAVLRLAPWPVGRALSGIYIGTFRNTPLLLQLFFIYFLLSPILGLSPVGSAVLALGAFTGAYMAEMFRAGLLAVPRAQWEAALSLGFGTGQTLRLVILPQAVRRMLPPLTSQIVSLIKDTSLVSAIAVADLTLRAQQIIAETFLAFEIWLLVAAIYLVLTQTVASLARHLEQRIGAE